MRGQTKTPKENNSILDANSW